MTFAPHRDLLGRPTLPPTEAIPMLASALNAADPGAAIAAIVAAARKGAQPALLVSSLLQQRLVALDAAASAWTTAAASPATVARLDATLTALDDALRSTADLHEGRQTLPVAVVAGWMAMLPPAARIALGSARPGLLDGEDWIGAGGDAAATVLARLDAGEAVSQVEAAVVSMLYRAPVALGGHAPVVAAALELRATCDAGLAAPLLASLAATLADAAGRAPSADDLAHAQRVAPIVAARTQIAGAEDESKAAAFQEAKFRVHLVDGDATTAERSMAKALAFGVPRSVLCASLGLAASERLLRFDATIDAAPHRRERWADVAWLVRVVEAVRRLSVRQPHERWLDLVLWATWQVQAGGALDLPADRRPPLPEPTVLAQSWDHGPEIARVVGGLARGDVDGTIANLRGYLLMGLPEAPLAAALVEAAFVDAHAGGPIAAIAHVGAMTAAAETFAALGAHPHRERVLAGALRLSASRRAEGEVGALAQAALDGLGGDRRAVRVPWPWLR